MAIKGNKNEEGVLLNVGVDTGDSESKIQELQKKLDALQEVKLKVSGDALGIVELEIKQTQQAIIDLNNIAIKPEADTTNINKVVDVINEIGDEITGANKDVIKPKTDDKELKNTILSISEMEDLLKNLRDEQKSTKDPLKLKALSSEAGELELKIRDLNEPFRDISREISEGEDRMYALASAGKAGTAEFNELLNKTASLKQQVILVDEAVDALSTNKLGAFISVGESMAGAFQGVTGALQLMGIESQSAEASIAKLMQLQSIVQGLQSINQFRKQWTALIASVKAGKVATDTINTITTATNEGAEASKNLAGGMEGTATATKSATTATKVFGTAFKAVGIGLLVAGIGFLIANFDKLKEIVFNLIPGLKSVADVVGKLVEKVTDFVGITSKAGRELEKLKRLNADITSGIDDQIEILSALGNKEKEVYELQLKRIRLKRNELEETAKVNKKYTDEELKQLNELNTQQNVLIITEKNRLIEVAKEKADKRKEELEKAKADYQQKLVQLKGYLKEAERTTYASNHNSRQIELKNLADKYKEQIDLAKKLHHDISKIEISQKIERDIVNRKYDDEYFNYIKNNQSQFLDSFSKEYLDSIKSFTEQKKNATDEQKADLDIRLNNQLIYLSKIQQLALSTREAEKDLLISEASNEGNEKDSFKIKKAQLEAIYSAQKDHDEIMLQNAIDTKNLENSELERIYQEGQARLKELMKNPEINAFDINILQAELNARLSAIDTNNRQIEDITFQHNLNLQKNEKANGVAKKKLLEEEKKVKLNNLSVVADATSKATELLGESTVAGKAMGIATATIDTYVAGAKAMKEVPYPFNFVALATTIASGLATVKKIISVKIPNATDTSGAIAGGGGNTVQAPVISSTILKSSENGTDSLATTIAEKQDNQVIKAYITNGDLESNQQKNDFINQISRF